MKKVFFFSIMVLGLAGCSAVTTPADSNNSPTNNAALAVLETGPTFACIADADCYCRSFNGAEFVDSETTPSICCAAVSGSRCPQVNYCQQCLYR